MGLDLPSKKRASKGSGFFILRGVCMTELHSMRTPLMSFPIEDFASVKTKIEEDLKLVATWFFENKLLINLEKTKLLLIGTRPLLGKFLEEITITFILVK
jgi:hypothetical protein